MISQGIWIFSLFLLCIYSYSQIDLNLTLSANPLYQNFQHQLIQLGYFNRPLSTLIAVLLLVTLFVIYIFFLRQHKKLEPKHVLTLLGVTSVLIFAYPAFSHDLFNYMFDARVVTKYSLNPTFFRALDFPNDEWTRFMHWTHRYFPYGNGWLALTLIPSFLGMGKFVLSLGLFKLLFLVFHGLNLWLISKLVDAEKGRNWSILFYGLNPLILIESLVSPHNEVMMVTFVLIGLYFLKKQKRQWSVISFFLGASVKFLSIILLPLALLKLDWDKTKKAALILWCLSLIPVVLSRELYSWYFIPVIAIVSLIPNKLLQAGVIGLSIGLLARYLPFLYFGEYNHMVTMWQTGLFIVMIITTGTITWVVVKSKP